MELEPGKVKVKVSVSGELIMDKDDIDRFKKEAPADIVQVLFKRGSDIRTRVEKK